MAPKPARSDTGYARPGYPVGCRNHPLRHVIRTQKANPAYLFVGKPGGPMGFPANVSRSPLRVPIAVIVGYRPEKQMLRVDARRVVAPVTHKHTRWDWAESPHPSEPMRQKGITPSALFEHLPIPSARGTALESPDQTLPIPFCPSVESSPEISRESLAGGILFAGHVSLLQGSLTRPGEALARFPGRSYSTRGEA